MNRLRDDLKDLKGRLDRMTWVLALDFVLALLIFVSIP
jgi:hypothetical protein